MSETKFTPGPWKATENAYGCQFVQRWEAGEAHDLICGGNSHDTLTKGNARLIAAAPDLLEALKAMSEYYGTSRINSEFPVEAENMKRALAAIYKAEGSQP